MEPIKKIILLAGSVVAVVLALKCLMTEKAIRDAAKIKVSPSVIHLERTAGAGRVQQTISSRRSATYGAAKSTGGQLDAATRKKLDRQAIHHQLRQSYSRFIKSAGLGEPQCELFVDLLEEEDDLVSGLMAKSPGANPWADFDDHGGYSEGPLSASERDLRELLGAEKYQEFCIYRLENPVRDGLKPLGLRLAYTEEPLRPEQLDALVASAWRVGIREYIMDLSLGRALPDAALADAKQVLSPVQYVVFKTMLDEKQRVSSR